MTLRRTLNAAIYMDEDDMALTAMGSFFADREQLVYMRYSVYT